MVLWLADWRALADLIAAYLLFAAGLDSPEVILDVGRLGELLRFSVLLVMKVELICRIDLPQLLVYDLFIAFLLLFVRVLLWQVGKSACALLFFTVGEERLIFCLV